MATERMAYDSGGYEWSAFVVFDHPLEEGRFSVDEQSGCSCYGYEERDDEELGAVTPLTKTEVIERWKQFAEENSYNVSKDESVRILEKLATL